MASRSLKVLSVKNANVYDRLDGGNDKQGNETSDRAAARNLLEKEVVIDGVSVRAFMLAEVPSILHPEDPFDRKILKGADGKWALPSPEWLSIRAKRIAEGAERAEEVRKNLAREDALAIVKKMVRLVDDGAAGAAAVEAAAVPVADSKKGEAPKK